MSTRSTHYPTMIENEKTGERVQVASDWEHHKKLLLWKEPGLEPVPIAPPESREALAKEAAKRQPDYPRMLENPKTGERQEVANSGSEELLAKYWHCTVEDARRAAQGLAPVPKTNPASAPPPPTKPPAAGSAKTAAAGKATDKGKDDQKGKTPPATNGTTALRRPRKVAELLKLGYPKSIAEPMAKDEQAKFDAGEQPYEEGD